MNNYPDVDQNEEDCEEASFDYDDGIDVEFHSTQASGLDKDYNYWTEEF